MSRKHWNSEKIFTRLLNNRTQKTFWDNIIELRKRPNKEVYNRAFELAKSSTEKEKIIGIYVLAQLGSNPRFQQQTLDLYFDILEKEKNPKVISAVLSSIGHNNQNLNECQITKLIKFQKHTYSFIRFELVISLLGVENKKAIETLIYLSKDKHSDIRNWSTFGLGTQIGINNPKIIQALWDRTKDQNQETKFEAIVGLSNRKESRVKEIIKRELKNGEYGTLLLKAIETLNDKDFLPLLTENLKIAEKDDGISNEWLSNLKECIEKINNRKTNAQH